MKSSILIKFAQSEDDLVQILKLQSLNLPYNITEDTKKSAGFVTVKHDLQLLTNMNNNIGQVIAKDKELVVGYALVMLKEFSEMIPVLAPMFKSFHRITYKSFPLNSYNYYVMGQICIAENYRGQGIFEKLYLKHRQAYSDTFDICLTEVASSNTRSMRAHEKIGFQIIHSFRDKTDNWNILLWDWNN